jgi:hypothetical protein
VWCGVVWRVGGVVMFWYCELLHDVVCCVLAVLPSSGVVSYRMMRCYVVSCVMCGNAVVIVEVRCCVVRFGGGENDK